MKRQTTITLFYTGVALVSAAILWTAFYIRGRMPKPDMAAIVDVGKETAQDWFEIEKDLEAVNQDGKHVRLSDLRGKVWIAAEFFAVCPHCAVRNGEELRKILDEFGKHPDFHIVCITVDPENDPQEKLRDYASALSADSRNWWFLNAGETAATHDYLEHVLKFLGVRKRTDPADIEANGLYQHDLSFILVDRDFKVVGKWPLAEARAEDKRKLYPELYDQIKTDLFNRIRSELAEKPQPTP